MRAPPPRAPPAADATSGSRKQRFMVSTRSHARRYDMRRRLADSEIEPVRAMASRRSALPGPIAISGPNITRSLSAPRRWRIEGLGGLRARDQLLQLARLVHLAHDVAAADELAVHVELRDRGPVRVLLDALADLLVLQHVDGEDLFRAAHLEELRGRGREAAHRLLGVALHVEDDGVGRHLLPDGVLDAHGCLLGSGIILPPATRGIPARSGSDTMSSKPAASRSARAACAWS